MDYGGMRTGMGTNSSVGLSPAPSNSELRSLHQNRAMELLQKEKQLSHFSKRKKAKDQKTSRFKRYSKNFEMSHKSLIQQPTTQSCQSGSKVQQKKYIGSHVKLSQNKINPLKMEVESRPKINDTDFEKIYLSKSKSPDRSDSENSINAFSNCISSKSNV